VLTILSNIIYEKVVTMVDTVETGQKGTKVLTTVTKAVVSREYDFTTAISHLKKVDPKLAKLMDIVSTTKLRERLLENSASNPFR
jgi:3-methyladenine DNA glycosylase/8-oxoguanine DNA glycosylase